jgi:mRNA-degrading endonuclease RelE of RelBE toxin-antitoxin system
VSSQPVWSERSLKDTERLDAQTRRRIFDAVERFATTGQGDIKRLHGRSGEHRLRVGGWRVLFRYEAAPEPGTVYVVRVLPRGRAYR